jgi:hypothetical protein
MKSVKRAKHTAPSTPATQPHKPAGPITAPAPHKLWTKARPVLPVAAFFLVYAVCLAKWINVALIYHGGGQVQDFPSFYWGWGFLHEFRTRPGGAVEYVSAFLAQALYSSWFGAFALTLQAGVVYACVADILRRAGAAKLRLIGLVPALLLLAVYSRYRHYSAPVTSFMVGAVAACAGWRSGGRKDRWRLGFELILAALLYAVAPSALFVFVPVVLVGAIHGRTGWFTLSLWVALACLVPWLEGAVLFGFAPGEAYGKTLPVPWDPIVLKLAGVSFLFALYCLPPLLCFGAVLWILIFRRRAKNSPPGLSATNQLSASNEASGGPADTLWKWETAGSVALPVVVVWLSLSPQLKSLMAVDFFAWHGRWPEVLEAARRNPRHPLVACAAAQASYHLGTLTLRLPNMVSATDLLLSNDKQQSHWKKSDLYFDLGYLNMALHHLTESMEFYGERPAVLRRLALVNLALTNQSTARVYLGTLARAPFQSGWARDYLELLKIDPTLDRDPEIARLRRLMVQQDSVVALRPDEELLMLLAANRQNRMAFEYLMTYYLLTKNLDGFVKQIPRIRDFPGLAISPLWDEALELAGRLAGRPVRVPGHAISREAAARVETVTRLVQQYGDKAEEARPKLAAEYGQTYTFYWWFHE